MMEAVVAVLFVFFRVPGPQLPDAPTLLAEDADGRIYFQVRTEAGPRLYVWNEERIVAAGDAGLGIVGHRVRRDGRRVGRIVVRNDRPVISFPDWERDQHGNRWALRQDEPAEESNLAMLGQVGQVGGPEGPGKVVATGKWSHLLADDYGFVWAGGEDGLLRFDPRAPDKTHTEREEVTALALSPDGLAMVAIDDGGLYEVDVTKDGRATHRRLDSRGLPRSPVRGALTASDGTIWAVTDGGVYHSRPRENAWRQNWRPLQRLPYGNHDIFGAVLDDSLYVGGGMASHGYPPEYAFFDAIFRYAAREDIWEVAGRLERPRCYAGTARLGDLIWVIGGFYSVEGKRVATDRVEILDPETGEVVDGPRLKRPRAEPVVVTLGGRIYVVGGAAEKTEHRSMVSIGPGEEEWRSEPAAPGPARQATGCTLGGYFYVFTGKHKAFRYDPRGREWTALPAPEQLGRIPRAALCAAHDGEVWLMGGWDTDLPGTSWIYSPDANGWRRGPDLPVPLGWGAAVEIDGNLIIAGGAFHSRRHGYFIFSDGVFMLRE